MSHTHTSITSMNCVSVPARVYEKEKTLEEEQRSLIIDVKRHARLNTPTVTPKTLHTPTVTPKPQILQQRSHIFPVGLFKYSLLQKSF